MSQSARSHDAPPWMRVRMIGASRAHRAMQKYGHLNLGTNLCPQVDEKFAEYETGKIMLSTLRHWLGQVHTDYVSTLDQTQVKLVKLRIRLMFTERALKEEKERNVGRDSIRESERAPEPAERSGS